MEHGEPSITWILACRSLETLRRAKDRAKGEADLDRVFADDAVAFPNGIEQRIAHRYRLGDYFDWIRVTDLPEALCFGLAFHPRHGADRYWKDLMVEILNSVSESGGVSIKSVTKSA